MEFVLFMCENECAGTKLILFLYMNVLVHDLCTRMRLLCMDLNIAYEELTICNNTQYIINKMTTYMKQQNINYITIQETTHIY